MSPPRATLTFVEKCPYTSGVRNAGVSGKRGRIVFKELRRYFIGVFVNNAVRMGC